MPWYTCICVCVLLVSTCCAAPAQEGLRISGTEIIAGNVAGNRMKRSAIMIGKAAAKRLLQGAKFIFSNGFDTVFQKTGGFKRAIEDFNSLNTAKLTTTDKYIVYTSKVQPQKAGKVGDRIIMLKENSNTGSTVIRMSKIYSLTGHDKPAVETIIIYSG